ncbi:MAG: homoserine O-acetyltransferase [Gordonia sp. (in: high G+C Gram-positive bacteria)]
MVGLSPISGAGTPPVSGHPGAAAPGFWAEIGSLTLESGVRLPDVHLFYERFGQLSPDKSNAILVFHGLGANSHLTRHSDGDNPGWWEGVVGPGRGLDTRCWCVISANILGGCAGSTGPTSAAPDGTQWAARFPALTIRDQVAAAALLGDALGITKWAAVVGVSFGGMHALEWHVAHPGRARRVAAIAAPWVTTAEQLVINNLQIDIVAMDPDFHQGNYARMGTRPHRGLALARQVGMLQYRAKDEFDQRFGRSIYDGTYAAHSYFTANADKFATSFDANSFITLVSAKNSHDLGRNRGGAEHALATTTGPLLVIGIESDRLFPLEHQRFIARHSPGSVSGAEPVVLPGVAGHDSFLIEQAWIGDALNEFLR